MAKVLANTDVEQSLSNFRLHPSLWEGLLQEIMGPSLEFVVESQ